MSTFNCCISPRAKSAARRPPLTACCGLGLLRADKARSLPHHAILRSLIVAAKPPVASLLCFKPPPAAMTVNHSTSATVGFPRTGECWIEPTSRCPALQAAGAACLWWHAWPPSCSALLLTHSRPPSAPLGPKREIKKALEAHWSGKITAAELLAAAADVEAAAWRAQAEAGIDLIGLDGTLYDQVLDATFQLGLIPERFKAGAGRGAAPPPAVGDGSCLNVW